MMEIMIIFAAVKFSQGFSLLYKVIEGFFYKVYEIYKFCKLCTLGICVLCFFKME